MPVPKARQGGDQANESASQLDCDFRRSAGADGDGRVRRNPAAGRRTSGHDRKPGWPPSCNYGVAGPVDVVQRR